MKLKKCLVILPLLALTLSACNTTKVSEPLDSSETTSEESGSTSEEETQTTLTNYTLSIEIRYNGDVEKVPEYADAYIQGGWDSWSSWVALTENNGRYEYTFASIDLGTYEYQLVLAYKDEEPGWTYRITQEGANASFTVESSDGDNYVNEVTITSEKTLDAIIPDPSAAINNVKVTIDITLDGVSQEVLDYGTLWIEGSWNWSEGFVACSVEDGKYVYTFTSLAPIEYEFLGVIYYKDEQLPDDNTLWDYKVNGDANCKFTVDSNDVSATLVATKALAEILPVKGGDEGGEPGEGGSQDNDTYSIIVSNYSVLEALEYDENATTQQVVILDISLVTTKGDGTSTTIAASAEDVTFTGYDQNIISISGLTITPLAAGTTSLTISWGEYASITLSVIVTDFTDSGEPSEEDPNLEAAEAILAAAADTEYLEWDALHAKEYEDDEMSAEIYLTLDQSSNAYGYWYQYDDGDPDTYNYYVDGTKYIYEPNEDEGDQYTSTTTGANIDLDTFLDDYSEALEDAEDIDLEDDDTSYTLDGNTLTVTVSGVNYYNPSATNTYTFVVNDDYEIIGVGFYGPDVVGLEYSGYYAELITYQDVVSVMATEFDITNWTVEEEGLGESITLYFTFTYGEQAQTLTEYEQIYLNGGWDGGNWEVTTTLSYDEESQLYYATITYGEGEDVSNHWFNFNLILEYSDAAFVWDENSIVLIDTEGGYYWSHESGVATATYTVTLTDTFENLLADRGAAAVTYVISIYHDSTLLEAAPDNINLYAAGSFNGTWNNTETPGWWDWNDPTLLENNGDGTYNLVLYELPQSGQTIEILVDDTTDSTQDMWNSILVSEYTLTSTDVDTSSSKTISLKLTTSYDGWYTDNGIFPPLGTDEEDFYVVIVDANNGNISGLTFTADIECWTGGSCNASIGTTSDSHSAYYSEVAKSVSGVSTNFTLHHSDGTHTLKTESSTVIPSNSDGTPVYVAVTWTSGWESDDTWPEWSIKNGAWYYMESSTTIQQFISTVDVSSLY